jgi:hypothetical protein
MQEFAVTSGYLALVCAMLAQSSPDGALGAQSLWTFAANLGLSVALVIFFVVKGDKREVRLANRISHLETFQEQCLIGMVEKETKALAENAKAQESFVKSMHEAVASLKDVMREMRTMKDEFSVMASTVSQRPCLLEMERDFADRG